MKTTGASAFSSNSNSVLAGQEMAQKALKKINTKNIQFAFVFASSEHDYPDLFDGIRSVLGNRVKIVGGTSSGIITNDFIGYEGIVAGIMIIATSDISFETIIVPGMDVSGEYEAGRIMGSNLKKRLKKENPNLLLFYDSISPEVKEYVTFYQAAPILAGIESELTEWPSTAGVGIVNMTRSKNNKLWDNDDIITQGLLSLILSGNVKMHTTIMHGLKPASDYHKITKTSGNIILKLDNKPATELVSEYMGDPESLDWKKAMYFITIGVNKGEKYGPFVPEHYVNRMVLSIDEKTGGLVIIEGDLKKGDHFQFMRRSIETDMIGKGARDLLDSLNGRKPLFALYISCLGRIKKIFGTDKEEAEEIQEALGNKIPLLGIYSGVEIAKVNNEIMPLDWTGVLCIFSEP